jgi:hypothetical protein
MNGKDEGFEQTTAIVEFDPIKRTLQEFRAKYGDRQFDVSTPDGFAEAKSVAKDGRKALVLLEKIRKARKERALRRCQQVDGEARTLREGIGAIFDPLFQMVDAEERRQEQEKREAEQRESERVAGIQLRIERLSPAIPYGAKAFQIVGILNAVRAVAIDDSFQEFEDDAYLARSASLSRLQKAFDQATAEEEAAAAREAELAAERAESARLRDQIRASEQAAAAAEAAARAKAPASLDGTLNDRIRALDSEGQAEARRDGESWIPPQFMTNEAGIRETAVPELLPSMFPDVPAVDAFDPPQDDDLAGRLIRQAERNVAAADGAAPAKRLAPVTADFFDDRVNDSVRICGVTYSGDFFRAMGDVAVGGWIRVIARDGFRVDAFRAPEECWIAFDEAAGVPALEGWSE